LFAPGIPIDDARSIVRELMLDALPIGSKVFMATGSLPASPVAALIDLMSCLVVMGRAASREGNEAALLFCP
jgi:hypothetical protein